MTQIQLDLNFESPQFDSLEEAFVHSVHTSSISMKHLAGEMNLLPAGLSKRLNLHPEENDPRFNLRQFEKYLEATGDYRPIYYLVERFLQKDQDRLMREFQEFKKRIPEIKKLMDILERK